MKGGFNMGQDKRARALELAGKLAVFYQEEVQESIILYYDEAIDMGQMLQYVQEEAPVARKYRDIFFVTLEGEQLPDRGFDHGELEQVAKFEQELQELLKA